MDFIDPDNGIHGIGVGHHSPEHIIAYVDQNAQVPDQIMGIPVVKKITGPLRSFDSLSRPVMGGASCGVFSRRLNAYLDGTVGMIVPGPSGLPLALSCNHVFCGISTLEHSTGSVGQPIWQPGSSFGGKQTADTFATQYMWMELSETGLNESDWALAQPTSPSVVSPMIQGIGIPVGIGDPSPGIPVTKSGAFSGLTRSVYLDVNASLSINYEGLFDAKFDNVCVIDNGLNYGYGMPGDSGSADCVMNKDGSIVATSLLFGGSSTVIASAKMTVVQYHAGFNLPTVAITATATPPVYDTSSLLVPVAVIGAVGVAAWYFLIHR